MKKLLTLLGSLTLSTTGGAAVVSCSDTQDTPKTEITTQAATQAVSTVLGETQSTLLQLQALVATDLNKPQDSVLKTAGIANATVSSDDEEPTTAVVTLTPDSTHVLAAGLESVSIEDIILPVVKIDLSTNTDVQEIAVTNDSTQETVLADLQKISGLENIVASDVTITIKKSTAQDAGTVTIKANPTSILVTGSVTLTIERLV